MWRRLNSLKSEDDGQATLARFDWGHGGLLLSRAARDVQLLRVAGCICQLQPDARGFCTSHVQDRRRPQVVDSSPLRTAGWFAGLWPGAVASPDRLGSGEAGACLTYTVPYSGPVTELRSQYIEAASCWSLSSPGRFPQRETIDAPSVKERRRPVDDLGAAYACARLPKLSPCRSHTAAVPGEPMLKCPLSRSFNVFQAQLFLVS